MDRLLNEKPMRATVEYRTTARRFLGLTAGDWSVLLLGIVLLSALLVLLDLIAHSA